jgi:hypothetical protein
MTEPRCIWIRDLNQRTYASGSSGPPLEEGYWRKEVLIEEDQVKNIRKKLVTTVRGLQFGQDGRPNHKTRNKNPGIDVCVFSEEDRDAYIYVLDNRHKVSQRIFNLYQVSHDPRGFADMLREIDAILTRMGK